MTDEFTKLAIDKQNEIASGEQLTHQEYLIFRNWYFSNNKNINRRTVVRSFDLFFAFYGMNVKMVRDDEEI